MAIENVIYLAGAIYNAKITHNIEPKIVWDIASFMIISITSCVKFIKNRECPGERLDNGVFREGFWGSNPHSSWIFFNLLGFLRKKSQNPSCIQKNFNSQPPRKISGYASESSCGIQTVHVHWKPEKLLKSILVVLKLGPKFSGGRILELCDIQRIYTTNFLVQKFCDKEGVLKIPFYIRRHLWTTHLLANISEIFWIYLTRLHFLFTYAMYCYQRKVINQCRMSLKRVKHCKISNQQHDGMHVKNQFFSLKFF